MRLHEMILEGYREAKDEFYDQADITLVDKALDMYRTADLRMAKLKNNVRQYTNETL